MNKIKLDSNPVEAITAMAEGVIGTARVLGDLWTRCAFIDPDNWAKNWWVMLALDNLELYGSNIWLFYKDVCGESYINMCLMLRGIQLGALDHDEVVDMVLLARMGNRDDPPLVTSDEFKSLQDVIKETLPGFNCNKDFDRFDWTPENVIYIDPKDKESQANGVN